ncbi:MAG: 4-alpha-glucanotransferase [Gammaproteobacteria bacterium]|nr:4-alpha-glucanotransferase [Gammaproteobacteria bacterium]
MLSEGRCAGVLLHPTSLPGKWEIGVLGDDARRFAGLLAESGFSLWQMLPVGPVGDSLSPYQATSAFAGNSRLIDPAALKAAGWLPEAAAVDGGDWPQRSALLRAAWEGLRERANNAQRGEFAAYWEAQRSWLLPYALFRVARERFGTSGWWTWPESIRHRVPAAISDLMKQADARIREVAFEQWIFDRQWADFRQHAASRGVQLMGDLPIYVDLDSADVWWHRRLFRVDPDGRPEAVAGVPPDYFSADGQVWGNPLYAWERMAEDGFRWWRDRVANQLRRFDCLRIDHFRGLQAYWEVPAGAMSAREGRWREAPGVALLEALGAGGEGRHFVAEDLGTITPEVHELRHRFGLPGMLVMQFAFDGSADNPYLPENHIEEAVIYTGTHDNDTLAGWYAGLGEESRRYVHETLHCGPADMPAALIDAVYQSRARVAILPFQDLLGLGSASRMNMPGTTQGNWTWRFDWSQVTADFALNWQARAAASGRLRRNSGQAPVQGQVMGRLVCP